MRRSGVSGIDYLRWGSHICQFFEGRQQLLDLLVPYFRAGLETNECCVWVTAPPVTREDALLALQRGTPDFERYMQSGQLDVFDYREWYLAGGTFEAMPVLKKWAAKDAEARARGFEGLRVSGNPIWLETGDDWNAFMKYEETVNDGVSNSRMIVLCTYGLDHCSAPHVVDVIGNHRATVVSTSKGWEVVHQPRLGGP